MKQVRLYDCAGWRLTAYGNGWAYLLEEKEKDNYAWFQDQDAKEFASQVMDAEGVIDDIDFSVYTNAMVRT